MEKLRILKKMIPLFILVLCLCFVRGTDVSAATTASYTTKTKDISKTYGNITANVYYKRIVLKGNSAVIKKINKSIKEDMEEFLNDDSTNYLYSSAEGNNSSGYKGQYYYTATSKVTYNKNGIISIQVSTLWYAGGVNNKDIYGLTYDLNTGKKLNLVNVCSGNSAKVKAKVLNKIEKVNNDPALLWDVLENYSVKKMDFYINKNGNAVVCFGPYEIGSGGWYRTFTIKSKYS